MIKIICLMNRKPGLSMEEFKTYYEEQHVPLIRRLLPFAIDYRRNFLEQVQESSAHIAGVAATPGHLFDVATELSYADEAMYRKMLDTLADPEIGGIIAADEAKFLDRTSIRAFRVDERKTAL